MSDNCSSIFPHSPRSFSASLHLCFGIFQRKLFPPSPPSSCTWRKKNARIFYTQHHHHRRQKSSAMYKVLAFGFKAGNFVCYQCLPMPARKFSFLARSHNVGSIVSTQHYEAAFPKRCATLYNRATLRNLPISRCHSILNGCKSIFVLRIYFSQQWVRSIKEKHKFPQSESLIENAYHPDSSWAIVSERVIYTLIAGSIRGRRRLRWWRNGKWSRKRRFYESSKKWSLR